MDWIKWLIPLVIVFVVILSNLARIAQEEKKASSRRRPGPGGPGDKPPRPRRPQSDAERFLEEINRRRREASEQRKPVVVQRAPAPPPQKPARRETPSATDPLARSAPTRPAAAFPVAEAPMPSKRPPPQRAPDPQRRQATPVLEEVVVGTVVPVLEPSGTVSAGAPAAVIAAKPETPTALMLRQLLRDPQSIKTAFVLREVLDRPLCRRPPQTPMPRAST
jgi:hypothetical protein